jgi:hypothetical protein
MCLFKASNDVARSHPSIALQRRPFLELNYDLRQKTRAPVIFRIPTLRVSMPRQNRELTYSTSILSFPLQIQWTLSLPTIPITTCQQALRRTLRTMAARLLAGSERMPTPAWIWWETFVTLQLSLPCSWSAL